MKDILTDINIDIQIAMLFLYHPERRGELNPKRVLERMASGAFNNVYRSLAIARRNLLPERR